MSKILKVKARQVFDSRGNPTVEAAVSYTHLRAHETPEQLGCANGKCNKINS